MPHPRFDPERCVRETLASLTGDREAGTHARHERLAATVACKAAIKAGDALSPGEMRALYVALRDTTLPAHDVHVASASPELFLRRDGRDVWSSPIKGTARVASDHLPLIAELTVAAP